VIRTTTLVVGVAAAAVALTITFTSSASTPMVRATFEGRTAQSWARAAHGWQQTAVKRGQLREWLQTRLTARVLEVRSLHRAVRRLAAQDTVLTDPRERNMLCIHGFEGSWSDAGSPYYGGMQMDLKFQRTYGLDFYRAWGTADHWPASVQIAVALRAYLTRGYGPWPNTARSCGLL
jgi:Transglycosylase-like domain